MALRGGETGPLVVAGDPSKSELYIRLTLPLDETNSGRRPRVRPLG